MNTNNVSVSRKFAVALRAQLRVLADKDPSIFGTGTRDDCAPWPIIEEFIHDLTHALAQPSEQPASRWPCGHERVHPEDELCRECGIGGPLVQRAHGDGSDRAFWNSYLPEAEQPAHDAMCASRYTTGHGINGEPHFADCTCAKAEQPGDVVAYGGYCRACDCLIPRDELAWDEHDAFWYHDTICGSDEVDVFDFDVRAALSPSVPAEAVAWRYRDAWGKWTYCHPIDPIAGPDVITEKQALYLAPPANDEALSAFKNFHRLLCERFGYVHDENNWQRDQLSLIEHIAKNDEAVRLLREYREHSRDWWEDNPLLLRDWVRRVDFLASLQEEKGNG